MSQINENAGKIYQTIDPIEREILRAIRNNMYITVSELAEMTGQPEAVIQSHLEKLKQSKAVKRVESEKIGYWKTV